MEKIVAAQVDKMLVGQFFVRQGEVIKLATNKCTMQDLTCDDIARLALAMYSHTYFFSVRRGLNIQFNRDLNGSGTQALFIQKKIARRTLQI